MMLATLTALSRESSIESIGITGRNPPCSASILLIMKGNIMSIEQVKALVNEMVLDGVLYASVAHNIDWARYEDENLRALLVSILIDLKGN
nr:MAG TPA: hypothetical protein [Bacteriophage sp.]